MATLELERIVKTYSDHILFPVELVGEDATRRQLNAASALWQRSKSEVSAEAYTEAYRGIAHQPGGRIAAGFAAAAGSTGPVVGDAASSGAGSGCVTIAEGDQG